MAAESHRIKVVPGSDLAALLNEAAAAPLILETNGELYRLTRMEKGPQNIWDGYDAEKVKQALGRSAGAFRGVETKQLLADIRGQRGQESKGRPAQ